MTDAYRRRTEFRPHIRRLRRDLKRIADEIEEVIQDVGDCEVHDLLEVAQEGVTSAARLLRMTEHRPTRFTTPFPDDGHGNSDEEPFHA